MMIAEVRLLTDNLPGLADFHKRILDIDNTCNDEQYQALLTEGTVFSIAHSTYLRRNQNIILSFSVEDDIDAVVQRALSLGATVYRQLEREPEGTVSLRMEEPDYNTVYLRSTKKENREVLY